MAGGGLVRSRRGTYREVSPMFSDDRWLHAMRALAPRFPFHYGWVIVVAGVLGNSATAGGTFWIVAVYITAIADDFGFGRTAVVGAFMVGQVLFAVIGPWIGGAIDRGGARTMLLVGSVAMPVALVATSFATELWQLYAGWALVSLTRSLLMPIPYNWLITRWFEGRGRQMSLGLVTTGFAMGGAVVLPLLAWVESVGGWQTAMIGSGVLVLVLHGTAALFVVADRPRDMGLHPSGSTSLVDLDVVEGGFSSSEALRSPVFWLVSLGLLLFFLGQGSVNNLIVDFFDSHGIAVGATLLAVTAWLRMLSRPPLSFVLLRVDRVFLLAMVVALSQAVATGVLVVSTGDLGIGTWILFWGFGGAFAPMLEPLLITRAFGVRHFGAISGLVAMISFGGQVVGPIGGALLFDVTNSYEWPFSLYAAGFALAGLFWAVSSVLIRGAAHRKRAMRNGMLDEHEVAEAT